MIEISKMGFQYSGSSHMALHDVNLTIRDGEFVGLIGVSGAGKTSLTHTLTGMIPHHYKGDFYGSVKINGMDTVECRGEDLYRIVGSVFQDIDSQMVASVVEDEILYGLENFGFSREEIRERLENVLDTLGIQDLRYRALSSLSGGQKQKVAIAAIVALRPQVIVLVKGQDTRKTRTSRLSRTIGFLFQNPDRQICKNTVREELAFSLQIHGMEEEEVKRREEEALERFRLQPDWEPFSRSRGERQRIALASVLIGEPELIILDEPTTGRDYRECTEIMEYVTQLNREKQVTVLMVSHDMELVQSYAQRVLVLSGGQLLGDGPVKQIMKQEDILHAARVLPAQIPALALRFGDRFRNVYTVEEMVAALEKEGC